MGLAWQSTAFGSPRSNRAIKFAAGLARTCRASLAIFHASAAYRLPYYVDPVYFAWPSEEQYLNSTGRQMQKVLAQAHADLIVIALYGRKRGSPGERAGRGRRA